MRMAMESIIWVMLSAEARLAASAIEVCGTPFCSSWAPVR
jgi:hypothetical protein